MNDEGLVTNFGVRPEIMRLIMYREKEKLARKRNPADLSFIFKVIKTVNWLNRIFFRYDLEYALRIKGEKEVQYRRSLAIETQRENTDSDSSSSIPYIRNKSDQEIRVNSQASHGNEQQNIGPLMDMLRRHCAAIYAKGDMKVKRFQEKVADT